MPFRAKAPFLQNDNCQTKVERQYNVSMPFRASASLLPARIMIPITQKELSINALSGQCFISTIGDIIKHNKRMLPCINALSGWGFISTVPLRKPRFYAVSGTCFCRYLSEYSNNDLFSCMLTIWTYLIVTITTWIFFSITLFLHFVIRYFYIVPITNSVMLQFMDKPDLDKFHACIEI